MKKLKIKKSLYFSVESSLYLHQKAAETKQTIGDTLDEIITSYQLQEAAAEVVNNPILEEKTIEEPTKVKIPQWKWEPKTGRLSIY